MGYEERFLYCEDGKKTKTLLDMLKANGGNDLKILAVLTLKRNWIARYKDINGICVNGKIVPFTYTSTVEIENPDSFYRKPSVHLTEKDISDMRSGKASPSFSEEKECFFNKGDSLIWVRGNRARLIDGYRLFGISDVAENVLFQTMHDEDFPESFLVEGKLDIVNALPWGNKLAIQALVSNESITDNEARVIDETRSISLDGIADIDNLLNRTDLFKRKQP